MSYSFNFVVATKDEAKTRVAAELDNVVAQQPSHARDRAAALAAAHTFIDMLADDDTKDVSVGVYGSVSWHHDPADPYGENSPPLLNASVGITAARTQKQEAATE